LHPPSPAAVPGATRPPAHVPSLPAVSRTLQCSYVDAPSPCKTRHVYTGCIVRGGVWQQRGIYTYIHTLCINIPLVRFLQGGVSACGVYQTDISQYQTDISQYKTDTSQYCIRIIPALTVNIPLRYWLFTPAMQWRPRGQTAYLTGADIPALAVIHRCGDCHELLYPQTTSRSTPMQRLPCKMHPCKIRHFPWVATVFQG
jgi:hypothetical protein